VSPLLQVLVPVLAGAVLGFVPNLILEGRKDRYVRQNKWSDALFQASVELMAASRRSQHLLEQIERGETGEGQQRRLDEEQQKLRVALEAMLILGDAAVQRSARRVVHHGWAHRVLVETGTDPHPPTGGKDPQARATAARYSLYRAVRHQLRIPNADDWAQPLRLVPEDVEELEEGLGR
jgi:hypothetical protein